MNTKISGKKNQNQKQKPNNKQNKQIPTIFMGKLSCSGM